MRLKVDLRGCRLIRLGLLYGILFAGPSCLHVPIRPSFQKVKLASRFVRTQLVAAGRPLPG